MFVLIEIRTLVFAVAAVMAILVALHSWQRRIRVREQEYARGFPTAPTQKLSQKKQIDQK